MPPLPRQRRTASALQHGVAAQLQIIRRSIPPSRLAWPLRNQGNPRYLEALQCSGFFSFW